MIPVIMVSFHFKLKKKIKKKSTKIKKSLNGTEIISFIKVN